MNRAVLAILSVSVVSQFAFAGHEVGNGGDVVVCRGSSHKVETVELLDYYEARTLRKIYYDLGPKTLSLNEKLELAIKRLESLSFMTAVKFRNAALAFEQEAVFLPGVVLADIPDSAHVAIPKGCTIEQIVVQRAKQFDEDKRYVVSKDLWDALDADNRAGLILHEIIYWDAVGMGHYNSLAARYYNSYLTADKFKDFRRSHYVTWLRRARFTYTYYRGMKILVGTFDKEGVYEESEVRFHDHDTIKKAVLPKGGFPLGNLSIAYPSGGRVEFHESGQVHSVQSYWGVTGYDDVYISVIQGPSIIVAKVVNFSPEGALLSADIYNNKTLKVGSTELEFRGSYIFGSGKSSIIQFHPNLSVKSGFLHREYNLVQADGTYKKVGPGDVSFDPEGKIIP